MQSTASHPICSRETFGDDTLDECRDSACRHSCKVYLRNVSHPQKECDSRTLQKNFTSPSTKNFPHIPATPKKRIKFPLRKWRGYGGSSGWVREVWRVGRPLRKGSPCASKVFPTLSSPSSALRDEPCGGQPPLQCCRKCRARRRSSIPHRRELQSVSFRSESAQCCSA